MSPIVKCIPLAVSRSSQAPRRNGFTLLEMSIVLVITSVLAVGAMVVFTQSLFMQQVEETNAKLATIQQALYNFRVAKNRLPCPADQTLTLVNTSFGLEAGSSGDCTATNIFAQTSVPAGAQDVREGMVPTRALELPDYYAYDSWGRRIMYAVTKDMTQSNAFSMYNGSDTTATSTGVITRITVNNASTGNLTTQAVYVLVSFGPNGHGGYPRNGGITRLNAGSLNTNEQMNCQCTNQAIARGFTILNNSVEFVQNDSTLDPANKLDSFDDIVVYAARSALILQPSVYWNVINPANNSMTCPQFSLSCTMYGTVKSCYCNQ